MSKELPLNRDIKSTKIRLVGENENRVVPFEIAIKMAQENGLDLVQVSEGDPPVCKIMDYKKVLFERKKKEHKNKQEHKHHQMKEIRVGPNVDKHDLETKANNARRFLEKGMKVLLTIKLKGRERQRPELALEKSQELYKLVQDISLCEQKGMDLILSPR